MRRKNHISFLVICLLILVSIHPVFSQEGIRFIPRSLTVSEDSVRIDLTIRAKGIAIPSEQALTLTPSLHFGKKQVALPPVVFSGSQRARFDKREEEVNPDRNKPIPYHVWITGRRRNDYTLRYLVSIPYASWMEHASLRLRQVSRDCCTELLLADDVLTKDIDLPSPCVAAVRVDTVVKVVPALHEVEKVATMTRPLPPVEREEEYPRRKPEQEVERRVAVTLYVDYVRGGSRVDPSYGNNSMELRKAERMLVPLLGDPNIYIKEIRITGYASPDGAYYDNEALAKARSLGFRTYLTKSYGLQDYPFRTAWVAEDWEGLRKLIKGKPYEAAANFIIDNYGIFEGRERYLMELQGRRPYQDMLQNLFPKLRRIELSILYNERSGYEK
ncbi:MAG: hypothetical protein ACK5N4_12280 [Parabacteroides gordonii]|uniref:hypothetical protein n=1 Tax=Parabacteroides gordonii TaxID=574930 RepID=UPI003A83ED11